MVAVATKPKPYIETRNGGYYVAGTRISLDSVVYLFRDGESPEGILQAFELLTLEKIYGALAFYLANRDAIDEYLIEEEAAFHAMPQPLLGDAPELYEKLMAAKRELADGSH